MISIRSFAGSDRGLVRPENEDSYLLYIPDDEALLQRKGTLAIVADGVGGGPAGRQASSMAVEIVKESYYRDPGEDNLESLREALQLANLFIYRVSQQDPNYKGMASTCTAFAISNREGFLSHVGDSRAYLLRNKELRQLSEDHTLVNELITEGIISKEEGRRHPQRNIILKALGAAGNIEPDSCRIALEEGDILLLCSDGLYNIADDDEISAVLSSYSAEEGGQRLIKLALERGAPDNVTVVIVRM